MEQWMVWTLTVGAGLSTCLGSLLCFGKRAVREGFLCFALAFSAGVMTAVSLGELLEEAVERNRMVLGAAGGMFTFAALCVGFTLAELLRLMTPEQKTGERAEMLRVGVVSLLAVAAHNLPEGMLVSLTSLEDAKLGIPVAVAIALHNIPEGVAIAAPVYYATGNRKKALSLAFFAGMAEPLGALIAMTLFAGQVNDRLLGALFAGVSGLMLAISFGELVPAAAGKDVRGKRLRQGLFAGSLFMLLVQLTL